MKYNELFKQTVEKQKLETGETMSIPTSAITISAEPDFVNQRIIKPSHVCFTNLDGRRILVKKELIETAVIDHDSNEGTVYITDYESEEISMQEFNKLVEALS